MSAAPQSNYDRVLGEYGAKLDAQEKALQQLNASISGMREDIRNMFISTNVLTSRINTLEETLDRDIATTTQLANSQVKLSEGQQTFVSRLVQVEEFNRSSVKDVTKIDSRLANLERAKRDAVIWGLALAAIIGFISNITQVVSWLKSN